MNSMLCNGFIKNNNPKSPIRYFELITVREYHSQDGGTYIDQVHSVEQFLSDQIDAIDEPFYRIYGKVGISDHPDARIFLGEFFDINKAKEFIYNLTGEIPTIISF